jgi:hypothetical protein
MKIITKLLVSGILINGMNIILLVFIFLIALIISFILFIADKLLPSLSAHFQGILPVLWQYLAGILYFSGSASFFGQTIVQKYFPIYKNNFSEVITLFLLSLPACIFPTFSIIETIESNRQEIQEQWHVMNIFIPIMIIASLFWAIIAVYKPLKCFNSKADS